jgi:hypothetical protein
MGVYLKRMEDFLDQSLVYCWRGNGLGRDIAEAVLAAGDRAVRTSYLVIA